MNSTLPSVTDSRTAETRGCDSGPAPCSTLGAVVLVLCEWAWGKLYLDIANKIGCPLLCDAARVEYRRALRVKRQLDKENEHTDHLMPEDVGMVSNA